MAVLLETDTSANIDISTAVSVGAYTATATRLLHVRVTADQVAGGGDYIIYATIQRAGAGSHYRFISTTTGTAAAALASIAFVSIGVPVVSGDVVTVWLDGLAGDNVTPDVNVDWFESDYVTGIANDAITAAAIAAGAVTELQAGLALETTAQSILADTGTDGVVVASLTTAAKALVQTEAEDALKAYDLDHLIQVTAGSEEPTDGSYLDQVMHKSASQTFDATTDSLEAIRDTLSSSGVTIVSAVDGDDVTVYTYSRWNFQLTGLGDISSRTALYFTVKRDPRGEADSVSMLQVKETTGALYLNRAAASSAAYASLVVDNETTGSVTVTVTATGVGSIAPERGLTWEVKEVTADGPAVIAHGAFHIDTAVARATT